MFAMIYTAMWYFTLTAPVMPLFFNNTIALYLVYQYLKTISKSNKEGPLNPPKKLYTYTLEIR